LKVCPERAKKIVTGKSFRVEIASHLNALVLPNHWKFPRAASARTLVGEGGLLLAKLRKSHERSEGREEGDRSMFRSTEILEKEANTGRPAGGEKSGKGLCKKIVRAKT